VFFVCFVVTRAEAARIRETSHYLRQSRGASETLTLRNIVEPAIGPPDVGQPSRLSPFREEWTSETPVLRKSCKPCGTVRWPEVMAEELLSRQKKDGTWINRYTDAKEDDPLVATPWAAAALAISRALLTGESPRPGDGCPVTGTGKKTG
jgi:hypothetical protein